MSRVVLVAGLGFGDEGKGTTVDWLGSAGSDTTLVVRYNGGAQAAHNVVVGAPGTTNGGRHHTFAQFGSATFSGVPTLLSRHMLVNPIALAAEARHLSAIGIGRPLSLLRVERDALVTTPFHVAANRLREMARTGRHGSCGMGIGETMEEALTGGDDVLRVRDLLSPRTTRDKLAALRERKLSLARTLSEVAPTAAHRRELDVLEDASTIDRCIDDFATFVREVAIVGRDFLGDVLRGAGQIVFEGAQGVLLDQDFGFFPHTTWTNITFDNARALLDDAAFTGPITKLGVVRAYATRHGAGPFVTEDPSWDRVSSHDHNRTGEWQGSFRSGPLDLVATRYALEVLGPEGVDGIVVTNVDRLVRGPAGEAGVPVCTAYRGRTPEAVFETDRGHAARIRVVRPVSIEHQARLTKALYEVAPVYEPFPREGYPSAIAERLGVELAVVSTGPTAADKQCVRRGLRGPREGSQDGRAAGSTPRSALSTAARGLIR